MNRRLGFLFLVGACLLPATEFQDYQAARAVIGQSSFSGRDHGVVARALSLGKGTLFVADTSGQVLTFDLARIGNAKNSTCPVCLVDPNSTADQSVFEGVAGVAVNAGNIVIADSTFRQVLIWRGASTNRKPDVVLSGFTNPTSVALDGQRLFVGDAGTHHVLIWNSIPLADRTADVVLGASDTTGADTIETPSALASDGTNLFVADSAARRVLVFTAADSPAPQLLNAASLMAGPVAPGTLVTLENASANSEIFLNGNPLHPLDSGTDQLQIQIPFELSNATAASLWVQSATSISRAAPLRFANSSPGIFAFGIKEPRTGMLLHAPNGVPLSPENPAKAGEQLTVWATGLGAITTEPNDEGAFETLTPVRATVNGVSAEVISATLPPEAAGIYEVRLRLPEGIPATGNLVLLQSDSKSNAVTFPVETNH